MDLLTKLFLSEDFLLWFALALLVLVWAWIAHQRSKRMRRLADRARRDAEEEDLGGNSYFMPLPQMQPAVEIADPVEIDSLLAGETEEYRANVRDQLEAATDIPFLDEEPSSPRAGAGGRIEPTLHLDAVPTLPPAPVFVPAPGAASNTESAPAAPSFAAPASAPAAAAPAPERAEPAPHVELAVPASAPPRSANGLEAASTVSAAAKADAAQASVRELVLTWFEARGYRGAPGATQAPPLEVILRHRSEENRSYGFIGMRTMLNADQSRNLLTIAKRAGISRLVIATESPCDADLMAMLRHDGIRVFDQAAIQAELEKLDFRVAAKIIAVAKGRGRASATAARPEAGRPPILTARF